MLRAQMALDPQSQQFHSLAGKLLLAETTLRYPTFCRSVIFLTEHTREGAHGYVMNQPMRRHVRELLRGKDFDALGDVPVFQGGPVSTERLSFACMGWDHRTRAFRFDPQLSTDDAREAHQAGKDVRAYVGYSGWSAGQMEREIEARSWIVQDAVPLLAEPEVVPDLWARVLRDMGPFFRIVSLTPDRPEDN